MARPIWPARVRLLKSRPRFHFDGLSEAVIAGHRPDSRPGARECCIDERSRLLVRKRRARAEAEEANALDGVLPIGHHGGRSGTPAGARQSNGERGAASHASFGSRLTAVMFLQCSRQHTP
jgi:hypothetical protein